MPMKRIKIIVATTQFGQGIGYKGGIPWTLKADFKYFQKITTGDGIGENKEVNAIIMGRKTWESINRPLPKRRTIIISTTYLTSFNPNVILVRSLREALAYCNEPQSLIRDIFIIGGSRLYKEAMESSLCDTIYQTIIYKHFQTDVRFPIIDQRRWQLSHVDDLQYEAVQSPIQIPTETKIDKDSDQGEKVPLLENHDAAILFQKREILEFLLRQHSIEAEEKGWTLDLPLRELQFLQTQRNSTSVPSLAPTNLPYQFTIWTRKSDESQYLELMQDILDTGKRNIDRTQVGTYSKFGATMKFSLEDGIFPLLTTKRVAWKSVRQELIWILKGCTDSKVLDQQGCKIWNDNGSREFLDKLGFTEREEGDLGPVYGHQWRHAGAAYETCHTDYTGKGIDQIKQVINLIKTKPHDRRILINSWSVLQLSEMALPPCHVLCQFYVGEGGTLSCQLYQRSCDMGLGVPFNIASYALLTYMIAQVCGLKPLEFTHVLGDYHIYLNHVDAIKEQLTRESRPFPTLRLNPDITDIDDFDIDDIEIDGYTPYAPIKMEMAV